MPPSSSLPTSLPPQINILAPPSLLTFSYPLLVSKTIIKKIQKPLKIRRKLASALKFEPFYFFVGGGVAGKRMV